MLHDFRSASTCVCRWCRTLRLLQSRGGLLMAVWRARTFICILISIPAATKLNRPYNMLRNKINQLSKQLRKQFYSKRFQCLPRMAAWNKRLSDQSSSKLSCCRRHPLTLTFLFQVQFPQFLHVTNSAMYREWNTQAHVIFWCLPYINIKGFLHKSANWPACRLQRAFCQTFCKTGQMTPLLKKSGVNTSDLANYRPITNHKTISKIREHLVKNQLQEHLPLSPNFNTLQSAYQSLHSTEISDLSSVDSGKPSMSLMLILVQRSTCCIIAACCWRFWYLRMLTTRSGWPPGSGCRVGLSNFNTAFLFYF